MITIEEGKSYVTNSGVVLRDARCVRVLPDTWRLKAEDGEPFFYTWNGLRAADSDGTRPLDLAREYVEPKAEPAPAHGIQIEEGKSYVTNDGHLRLSAYRRSTEPHQRFVYPWALSTLSGENCVYTDAGRCSQGGWGECLEREYQEAITNTPHPGEPKDTRARSAPEVFIGDIDMPWAELAKLAAEPSGPLVAHTEPKTIRHKVLDAAKKAVAVRNEAYGTPEDNFERIARRWTVHLMNIGKLPINAFQIGFVISPADVALMLADVKVARIENDPKHVDSWIDIAGYAACGAECEKIAIDESPLSDK